MSAAAGSQAVRVLDPVVVAIAASAGGVQAPLALTAALPAAVLVAQHLAETPASHLAQVLARRCPLPVRTAVDGDSVRPGLVLVCPGGSHLLLAPGPRLWLPSDGPVNFVRPSADRLFESLARTCGRHAIAVVLSGSGRDGAVGVRAVKAAGGTVIVEDRTTAQFYGMPKAAIRSGAADLVLPIQDIPGVLVGLILETCNEPN